MGNAKNRLSMLERAKLSALRKHASTVLTVKKELPSPLPPSPELKYGLAISAGIIAILIIFLIYFLREIQFPHLRQIFTLDFWTRG